MSIPKFTKLVTTAVPLPIENVDTDQIIPARFLKAVERKGFGDNLFRDWRYDKAGKPVAGFPLNDSRFGGDILVAAKNYGFKVVVSSFFADIFRNNALNNGLLPIRVDEAFLTVVFAAIEADPAAKFEVDLDKQTFTICATGETAAFEIDGYKKECLLNGYDDVDYLLSIRPEIDRFEAEKN